MEMASQSSKLEGGDGRPLSFWVRARRFHPGTININALHCTEQEHTSGNCGLAGLTG